MTEDAFNDENKPTTATRRPLPERPKLGFEAWQLTLGYILYHHSPDAILKFQAYPVKQDKVRWSSSLTWASNEESILDSATLADALGDLWQVVDQNHDIFAIVEDRVRCPEGYDVEAWFEPRTIDSIQRLVWTADAVYPGDWLLVNVYHPTQAPDMRFQARLIAPSARQQIGGRGPSLLNAVHDLFRNAAPVFADAVGLDKDDS